MTKTNWKSTFLVACAFGIASCSSGDPPTGGGDSDIVDSPIQGSPCSPAPSYTENVAACVPATTDYHPRTSEAGTGDWPDCISDDNIYHRIQTSISSIARVEAGDAVGAKLWDNGATPTNEDFLAARIIYEEEQGLGSRVARRYDKHYTAPATGKCDDAGVADANEANRKYCVGPATLLPIIVDAFADGALGNNRIVNAAKIQAAIQWFFYVSAYKEANTCTTTAKDCDSSWAYYTGGTPRGSPVGLAADIDALAPETHDRAYDGALAVRCWRGLENNDAGEATQYLARRDLALAQYDKAMVRGMALLVRQRFAQLECATGDYQTGALEALRILVPLLDRETSARDVGTASLLKAEVAKDAGAVNVTGVLSAIDTVYDCP